MQKSVLKDTKSHSIHVVNPKALLIDRSNFQSSKKSGINIEWLKGSNRTDIGRNILIQGNEIKNAGKDGLIIQSYLHFSAHNAKILIKDNEISKCNGDGVSIKNLAISTLDIIGNEVTLNQ